MLTHTIAPDLMAEISTLVLVLMAHLRPAPANEFALVAISDGRTETRP